ncbi:MAG TPA: hypothetical protein VK703_10545 [Candidatus Acidoferrales bacterium]|jgi:hypothetical protein|nr:hypothetical protein [Candidatus Acidoferrales bacterium]
MWNRACPLCFTKVPRSLILTRGDELTCPSCGTPLELSRASRVLGAACGLAVAFVAAHAVWDLSLKGRWALPVLAAILGYGIASALVLYFLADLVVQPKPPHMAAH